MKLKNIRLAFGGATSPTAITAEQVQTLLRVIQDGSLTTKRFSGYVASDAGIKGSEAWVLAQNGITYVGATLPDGYTISPSAPSLVEGNEVSFIVDGVPQSAIGFSVESVNVTSGGVNADYVKALLSFNGNKLVAGKGTNLNGWSATVRVKGTPLYPSTEVQYATVTLKGRVAAQSLSAPKLSFAATESKAVAISYAPSSYNIPIVRLEATLPEGVTEYVIREAEPYSVRVECVNLATLRECNIALKATDAEGNVITGSLAVDNKVVPVITFNAGEIKAKMGAGSKYVEFNFNPAAYNVPVTIQNVTSSNSAITVSDVSNVGFTINVSGIEDDVIANITATFLADGKSIQVTGSVTAKYVEDDRPFILINDSDSEVSFSIQKSGNASAVMDCNYAIVSNYTKGDDSYNFDGVEYTKFTGTQSFTLPAGASLFLYSEVMTVWGAGSLDYSSHFVNLPASIEFDGDIMALIKERKFTAAYAFSNLFNGCSSLVNAPELPATSLQSYCYCYMFKGCAALVNGPSILPATILVSNCYNSMFSGCTSLVNAPMLPATTLSNECYFAMFSGCTSLVNAPALPATVMKVYCYQSMFSGCTSLVNAPALPSTELANSCYQAMFNNCKSLEVAPTLPTPTLVSNCYNYMFYNCTNLRYIKMLAIDISASYSLLGWTGKVAANGTFVKHHSMTSLPTGENGIPSGWTVLDATD